MELGLRLLRAGSEKSPGKVPQDGPRIPVGAIPGRQKWILVSSLEEKFPGRAWPDGNFLDWQETFLQGLPLGAEA